jgi:hypothetical protein
MHKRILLLAAGILVLTGMALNQQQITWTEVPDVLTVRTTTVPIDAAASLTFDVNNVSLNVYPDYRFFVSKELEWGETDEPVTIAPLFVSVDEDLKHVTAGLKPGDVEGQVDVRIKGWQGADLNKTPNADVQFRIVANSKTEKVSLTYPDGLKQRNKIDKVMALFTKSDTSTFWIVATGNITFGAENHPVDVNEARQIIRVITVKKIIPPSAMLGTMTDVQATDALAKFALEQNYPNPFNPTTEIRFELPEPGNVSLTIYDLMGRKIAVLADGNYPSGSHSVVWNAKSISSGEYVYKIQAGTSFTKSRKLVLMK